MAVGALSPGFAIWYLLAFSATPPTYFESHGFHEFAIAIATLIGGFVSYVSWRSYCASGEVFLRWLTAGFLVFTLVYAPHGLLTRMAHHNIWLFLLYGPVSRLAMLGCLVYGLAQYGKPTENPAEVARRGFWWRVVVVSLLINVAVAVLAYSPIAASPWVRMPMEAGALTLCLATLAVMAWRRIGSPLMMFYAVALLIFGQAAIAFMLAKPWNHLWWLAHAIFAAGFSILSWGVTRALLTTRSFALAYSQEQLMRALEHKKEQADSANRELHESQVRMLAVLNGVQDGVITIDKAGIVQSFNQSAVATFGYAEHEVTGRNISMLMPEPYRSAHDGYLQRYADTGSRNVIGHVREVSGLRKDGTVFPMELWVNETIINGEQLFTGSVRDVTALRRANEQLRIAAAAFEAQEGIIVTDADCKILRVNSAFLAETGFAEEDLVGNTPAALKTGVHDAAFYRALWAGLARTGRWQGEITGRRSNGDVYPKWLTISAVRTDSGAVSHYVSTHVDITERKRMEDEVRHLAFYDPLTQLANRRLLNDRLRQTMATGKRSGCHAALLFIDLDNFKPLNDQYGHEVGDLLLIEVANRLRRCVREIDTVARFGGDEFVVILGDLTADRAGSLAQAEIVAEKVRSTLAEAYLLVIKPAGMAAKRLEHHCTASIGMAIFRAHEASQDDILRWADTAMYRAKEAGRNSIRPYPPEA